MIEKEGLTLSIRNGLYMPFMYKGHQIVVHNAAWSFREKIWVDDQLVVNQPTFAMTATHTIDVAGDPMTITFGYKDYLRVIFIRATVGDTVVHNLEHRIAKAIEPKKMLAIIVGWGLAGAVVGYAFGHYVGRLLGGS